FRNGGIQLQSLFFQLDFGVAMMKPIPTGPCSRFPFENELSWSKNPREFLLRTAQKYGDICKFRLRGIDLYFVSDPELVREVLVAQDKLFVKGLGFERIRPWLGNGLVTSEGEVHKRQRRLLQSAFHRQRIEAYAQTMQEEAEKACASLQDGQAIDLLPFIEDVAFRIATACMFDENLDAERPAVIQAMRLSSRYMDAVKSYSVAALWRRWTGQAEKEKWEAIRLLHTMVDGIIASRRQDTEDRGDLLSMLVLALDEEGDGKGLSDQEVRDQVITLLVAGFDTIASSLTTCIYQLARHPDAEQCVVDEMAGLLGGRPAGFAESLALGRTTAAFSEAIRLYPAGWLLPRRATADVQIGDYLIPENATVVVSPYVNHHDPRYFPDPEQFKLERWPEQRGGLPKMAYYPFGAGSRVCIGQQFAWMEANIVLASFLQRWRFEPAFDGTLPYKSTMSLRPANNCPGFIRKRT
ncbi:MAG: hypothetical protein CTY16_06080, partial [Methylobacter sp.]